MNRTGIKKIGSDHEGPIVAIILDGEQIGTVAKWKGLFISPEVTCQAFESRTEIVAQIVEIHEFNAA